MLVAPGHRTDLPVSSTAGEEALHKGKRREETPQAGLSSEMAPTYMTARFWSLSQFQQPPINTLLTLKNSSAFNRLLAWFLSSTRSPQKVLIFQILTFFTHSRQTYAPSTPDRPWFSLYVEAVSLLDEASSSMPTHATTETRVKVMHLDTEHTYQMVLQQASTRSYTFLSSPFPWH